MIKRNSGRLARILKLKLDKNLIPKSEVSAREWFRLKASEISRIPRHKLLSSSLTVSNIVPGGMYMFVYNPKHKETLPYYDAFPLLLPYQVDKDGFTGLNLHYLPKSLRAVLMDALYDLATDQRYDASTRIAMSYSILKSSTKYKYFEPCLKRYLHSHVRSRFIFIPANEWDIALFLPTENFQKAPKQKVHSDSIKMVNT